MEYEFDNQKSISNKKKHGIDFIEIQLLWNDSDRLEIPAKTSNEKRIMVIGKIKNNIWSAILTFRNEKIRIISARRSSKKEMIIYES